MLKGREMSRADEISWGDERARVCYASVPGRGRRRFTSLRFGSDIALLPPMKKQPEEGFNLYKDCIHMSPSDSCLYNGLPREKFWKEIDAQPNPTTWPGRADSRLVPAHHPLHPAG